MAEFVIGEVPGVEPGSAWRTRAEVAAAGIHRPLQAGICGGAERGAESIVISGGYEDDVDLGSEIIFTGHGGQDASKRQIADQSFTDSGNAALVSSQQLGQPVRVVRGAGGDELLSPTEGYRYDGLYTVLDHWMEPGLSGFQVCRFRLFEVGTGGDRTFEDEALPQGNHNPEFTTRSSTSPARDGTVTRRIKSLYEHACQMCDITIESPKGPIAEGAHVRPLGRPHNGPDVPANLLCLCPNCHRKFDAGAVHITDTFRVIDFEGLLVGPLHRDSRHKIAVEHLAYHRQVICGLEE